jgi:acetyl esterase
MAGPDHVDELDPFVVAWLDENPMLATPFDLTPEMLEAARSSVGPPPTRPIANVTDELVGDVPVRIYAGEGRPTGLIVYFHGGGFVMGSIGLMDNVARELASAANAVLVSVGYRLAPEHPFPAGLDDCEAVTRWAHANASRFDVSPASVAIAGESAGGNLTAAVALRLREQGSASVAGQVLIYPCIDALFGATTDWESRTSFGGVIVSEKQSEFFWTSYSGGKDITRDPFAAPIHAETLKGVPPALVILAGCDQLRDEGRAYAQRMQADGVAVEEICYDGQPHGFMNFELPAAAPAFERIGAWLRSRFEDAKDG